MSANKSDTSPSYEPSTPRSPSQSPASAPSTASSPPRNRRHSTSTTPRPSRSRRGRSSRPRSLSPNTAAGIRKKKGKGRAAPAEAATRPARASPPSSSPRQPPGFRNARDVAHAFRRARQQRSTSSLRAAPRADAEAEAAAEAAAAVDDPDVPRPTVEAHSPPPPAAPAVEALEEQLLQHDRRLDELDRLRRQQARNLVQLRADRAARGRSMHLRSPGRYSPATEEEAQGRKRSVRVRRMEGPRTVNRGFEKQVRDEEGKRRKCVKALAVAKKEANRLAQERAQRRAREIRPTSRRPTPVAAEPAPPPPAPVSQAPAVPAVVVQQNVHGANAHRGAAANGEGSAVVDGRRRSARIARKGKTDGW